MMAPTEVLAKQHYESTTELFATYGIEKQVVLVTGSMTAKEKRIAYEKIASHEADIIVGTHALIQEKVHYDRLALVITDEQHRFWRRTAGSPGQQGQQDGPGADPSCTGYECHPDSADPGYHSVWGIWTFHYR